MEQTNKPSVSESDGNPRFAKKRRVDLKKDKYLDHVPLKPEQLIKYDAGASKFAPENAKTRITKKRFDTKKKRFLERAERTARAELLNKQEPGAIETDEGMPTFMIRQKDIVDSVDTTSATKHFTLDLKFGPYRIDYTRNGRNVILGGNRGHIAAFDWMTKDLKNETNVMETVRDVKWLHVDTMYAVAQKRWVRIYDNQGIELHCMKSMSDIKRLEFLPRHFLLVASGGNTCLHYLDVSIGKIVAAFPTGRGSLDVMTQNPANAIVLLGDSRGRVSMWSPNAKEPLVEMLVHQSPVRGVAVDQTGLYMATVGLDRRMRIWDLRTYNELFSYGTKNQNYDQITFSQRGFLATSSDNLVQVFKDVHLGTTNSPYMVHRCQGMVSDLQFCPYEDVLGVGHADGFLSLIIPGSGEPNFDGLRDNPFESKKQRREKEVRMLLEKIQPELITLDPTDINKLNRRGLKETLDYKEKVMRVKPTEIIDA